MGDDLKHLDKTFLLAWFRNHMTMEQRGMLMRDLPTQYNRLVGQDVVRVIKRGWAGDELNAPRPPRDLTHADMDIADPEIRAILEEG